jgi:putative transposase
MRAGQVGGQAAWQAVANDHGRPNERWPDLVNRDFTADRPDALWVADFSYVRCYEGMVFFSFVIDVYSRRIAGWQVASHMRTDLVLDARRMALTRREHGTDVDLIHHSDAGRNTRASPSSRRSSTITTSSGRSDRSATLRQRHGRELRRHVQDRTDRRPRLAHQNPARARDRRVGRPGFNTDRLHESIGDIPPAEFEALSFGQYGPSLSLS